MRVGRESSGSTTSPPVSTMSEPPTAWDMMASAAPAQATTVLGASGKATNSDSEGSDACQWEAEARVFKAALDALGRLVREGTTQVFDDLDARSDERYLAAPDKAAFLRASSEAFIASNVMTLEQLRAGRGKRAVG